ncbi:Vacuolar protein sorting-associated protein 20 [Elasticomyces elasticus]|nr:Vacuolar protein sorting-associated protein 20 [Elasticomyces elasticus]
MGNSSSTPKITAQDRAILDMKNQRDKLHEYQKRITVITSREKEIAKECLAKGDKKRALLALRRKKYQESLLTKTDQQLAQLEILTSDVEFALVQKDVLFGLQQGTSVLKEIHKEMGGIQNVEKLLGEGAEARAYQNEISEMLSNRMSNQDEDEVEDELDALEREVSGVKMPDAPTQRPIGLPDAPSETPKERAMRRAVEQHKATEPMLA